MHRILISVYFTVILMQFNEGARILAVFPIPSISHQVVFRPLTQELARRGHDVVVVTPDPAFNKGMTPENLTEIDVHEISYAHWEPLLSLATGKKNDLRVQVEIILDLLLELFEKQMKVEEFQSIIGKKKKKFDILLLEACVRPALSLSHLFDAPVILVSSFGATLDNFEVVGAPDHPFLYPLSIRQRIYNLTPLEKIEEFYKNVYELRRIFKDYEYIENEVLRKLFSPDIPALSQLKENVHMLFLNIHPIWDGNRSVPPNVLYMGGMHQNPQKELPKELKSYLDSSTNGVIYVSFGTNVNPSLLPEEKIQIIFKTLSRLPYNVLLKWGKEEVKQTSKNIKIMQWFPQSDLLRHPNIKLFITQGGLQSTDEAITAGVPLIGIPMLGDQWFNTEKYVHHGIGLKIELETLTEEQLFNAINTVINNPSYRRNIMQLRSLMMDQPQSPLERAVWWTEYVIRHKGARHLKSPAANMPWTEYYELNLLLTVLVFALLLLAVFLIVLFYTIKLISKYVSIKAKIKVN